MFLIENYSMADFATDLYTAFNGAYIKEPNVAMNIYIIAGLCNAMETPKIAQRGVYLNVTRDISLMIVDEKEPHNDADIVMVFHEEVKQRLGVPFSERHTEIHATAHDKQTETIISVVSELCKCAGFITEIKP